MKNTDRYLPYFLDKLANYVFRRDLIEDLTLYIQERQDEEKNIMRIYNGIGYKPSKYEYDNGYAKDLWLMIRTSLDINHMKSASKYVDELERLSQLFPTVSKERFEMEVDSHRLAMDFIAECGKAQEYKEWINRKSRNETNGLRYLLDN